MVASSSIVSRGEARKLVVREGRIVDNELPGADVLCRAFQNYSADSEEIAVRRWLATGSCVDSERCCSW